MVVLAEVATAVALGGVVASMAAVSEEAASMAVATVVAVSMVAAMADTAAGMVDLAASGEALGTGDPSVALADIRAPGEPGQEIAQRPPVPAWLTANGTVSVAPGWPETSTTVVLSEAATLRSRALGVADTALGVADTAAGTDGAVAAGGILAGVGVVGALDLAGVGDSVLAGDPVGVGLPSGIGRRMVTRRGDHGGVIQITATIISIPIGERDALS